MGIDNDRLYVVYELRAHTESFAERDGWLPSIVPCRTEGSTYIHTLWARV